MRQRRTRRRRARANHSPRKAGALMPLSLESTGPASLLLTQSQVLHALQLGRTAFWKIRTLPNGHPRRFPDPLQLGTGLFCLRWRRCDVERWIDQQASAGAAA
jgi:predicted DNA-binding transcriptional regulator AlpA